MKYILLAFAILTFALCCVTRNNETTTMLGWVVSAILFSGFCITRAIEKNGKK